MHSLVSGSGLFSLLYTITPVIRPVHSQNIFNSPGSIQSLLPIMALGTNRAQYSTTKCFSRDTTPWSNLSPACHSNLRSVLLASRPRHVILLRLDARHLMSEYERSSQHALAYMHAVVMSGYLYDPTLLADHYVNSVGWCRQDVTLLLATRQSTALIFPCFLRVTPCIVDNKTAVSISIG